MEQWAPVVGLGLTAFGIIIGFYMPRIAAVWGGPKIVRKEQWLRIRFAFGMVLVFSGTLLQIYGAWPP